MSIIDENQAAELSDVAISDLQLSQQPFATNTATGETFLDGIADAQLNDIKQALISGDDLLLVLGPEGSGKSTLLKQLSDNSGQRIQCFSVRGNERFSTANLFAGMLEAFQRPPPGDLKQMLDDLIPALQGMADSNTLGAVVLDDADQIPEEELTKLLSGMLYINGSEETLLRVTLAAPTEFEERIPELLPEGADLPYSSLAIDAFDKDRSAAYLDFRLQQAGLSGDFPFTDTEIASINEEAGGRPGFLHVVAAQELNLRDENYVAELPPELSGSKKASRAGGASFFSNLTGNLGGTKLMAGAAALFMIFAGLFWLKPSTNNVPDDRYTVVETKKLEANNNASNSANNNTVQTAETGNAQQLAEASNQNSSATNGTANAGTATPEAAAAQAAADKAEAQLQAKREAESAELAQQKAAQAAEAALAAKEKAEKVRADAEKAAAEKVAKAAEEVEAKKTADAAAAANLANLESPNWILVQNPSLFTVQMSASTDRKSVEAFLARNELQAPNSIFSFNRNGATWFALVHGLYDSIEQARQEVEKMPESARSNQPWIRAIGRIQNAVKEE